MATGGARPALFVDLDGTVRETCSGRTHPIEPRDQRVLPGVAARLAAHRARGYAIVGVTNQGGVAFGTLTEADVRAINAWLEMRLLPGLFDLILYCAYHPWGDLWEYRREAECRKPRPGMAYEARDRLGLDLAASLMVGDREADRGFAANAGIGAFHWAADFFAEAAGGPGERAETVGE